MNIVEDETKLGGNYSGSLRFTSPKATIHKIGLVFEPDIIDQI